MSAAITFRFAHRDDSWRIMCQASSGHCILYRNGTFVKSTTYAPDDGIANVDGLAPGVVPKLLNGLAQHAQTIRALQRMAEA